MDKNNIHLDDLFKNKLVQGEDYTNLAGAWAKMEALLDQDVKETPKLIWWKSKWFTPMMVTTLVITAATAYLATIETNSQPAKSDNIIAKENVYVVQSIEDDLNEKIAVEGNTTNHFSQNDDSKMYAIDEAKDNLVKKSNSDTKINVVNKTNKNYPASQPNADIAIVTTHKNDKKDSKSIVEHSVEPSLKSLPKSKKNSVKGKIDRSGVLLTSNHFENTVDTTINSLPDNAIPVVINNEGYIDRLNTSKSDKLLIDRNKNTENANAYQNELISQLDDDEIVIDKVDNKPNRRKERNVKEYTLVERNMTNGSTNKVIDTISVVESKRIEYIPITLEEMIALQGLNLYRINNPSGEYDYLKIQKATPTNNKKVSLYVSNENKIFTNKESVVSGIIKDVNTFFTKTSKFYGTINAGLNSSPNNITVPGYQIGAGLHYKLNRNWSIGFEAFFNNKQHDYTVANIERNVTPIGNPIPTTNGYIHNYQENSNTTEYSIKSTKVFEIPLLVGYQTKNWNFFIGPSLNIGAPIKYDRYSFQSQSEKTELLKSAEFDIENISQKVDPNNDFKALLGIGLTAGIQYNLSDRFAIEARYNQVFSDNATTSVNKIISDNVFKSPNLRLGIQFKLISKKSVFYMLNSDKK